MKEKKGDLGFRERREMGFARVLRVPGIWQLERTTGRGAKQGSEDCKMFGSYDFRSDSGNLFFIFGKYWS